MIVEQRTYTIKPLRTADFLELYERAALPLQKKYLGIWWGFSCRRSARSTRSFTYGLLTVWPNASGGAS